MFNLTSKKYWFFLISLLVIIPGLFGLFKWGLNPGIDFTGGTTVDLRFQKALPTTSSGAVQQSFEKLGKAKDVKIYFSTETGASGNQLFWVQLDRSVDSNV